MIDMLLEFIKQSCNQSCLTYDIIGVMITSVVIIFGWGVNNRQANTRQLRIEQLNKKEELCKEIDKLVTAARDYYVGNSEKRKLVSLEILDLTSNIDRIIGSIDAVDGELYKKYTQLFEAITDGSFGSDAEIDIGISEEKCKRIILAKNHLYNQIEIKFNHTMLISVQNLPGFWVKQR